MSRILAILTVRNEGAFLIASPGLRLYRFSCVFQ
jgi:hypothetical protein